MLTIKSKTNLPIPINNAYKKTIHTSGYSVDSFQDKNYLGYQNL